MTPSMPAVDHGQAERPGEASARPDANGAPGQAATSPFGLIFVLYQPTEVFLDNLARAREICPSVVAVDNSPEPDMGLYGRLRDEGMQVLFNQNQGGLAGAYNRGAELLLAQGCEVLFLLDQDSQIEASFLPRCWRRATACSTMLSWWARKFTK